MSNQPAVESPAKPAQTRLVPMGRSIIACDPAPPDNASMIFAARNPATGTVLPTRFQAATRAQVNDAANLAWKAFHAARATPDADRAVLLRTIADRIKTFRDDLIPIAHLETGLPKDRLRAELERTTGTLELFADVIEDGSWRRPAIDTGDPTRKPIPKPTLRKMLLPLGPIAVFGASNFPFSYSTMGTDSASALAAGCPVIVKGHPLHPGTGEIVAQVVAGAVRDAGFPDGWFSFLHAGDEREHSIGTELLGHPCVRAAGFTGSLQGGTTLAKFAANRPDPIPLFAEMGSTNPAFILPGGLGREPVGIAQHLARAISQFAGQQCTRPGLIYVVKGAHAAAFIERLILELRGVAPMPMLGAKIRKRYLERLELLIDLPGVRTAVGDAGSIRGSSDRVAEDRPTLESPVLLRTDANTFLAHPTLQDEIFGPASIIVECESAGEIIECAGLIQGTISTSVFLSSEDLAAAEELVDILTQRAGRIVFNGVTTGVEVGCATVHGGPYPASNRPETTSVGPGALERWCRPVTFQNAPGNLLPPELADANPGDLLRTIDGSARTGPI